MEHTALNVVLIGENARAWWHLGRHLEQMGCTAWFASTSEEARAVVERHLVRVILSGRPVTERSPIMRLVRPGRSVFYSVPVESGCLWFEAMPEVSSVRPMRALRPAEFIRLLDNLIRDSAATGWIEPERHWLPTMPGPFSLSM